MDYKKRYQKTWGYTRICQRNAGSLKRLEFGIIRLKEGDSLDFDTKDMETAFVMLEGRVNVSFGDTRWENIGNRETVFDNRRAESFYMPMGQKLQIQAVTAVKIAVCSAAVQQKTEPQLLRSEQVELKLLGRPPYERETSFIIDERSNAVSLTVGEAYVTDGNWAGFPPHKHDVDHMPEECIAEELYYFLFHPEQGFAVQCLYTEDGEIEESYRVKSDELVEFPRGYHTTVAAPGYATYFLWAMAGDYQGFHRSSDPAHAWMEK